MRGKYWILIISILVMGALLGYYFYQRRGSPNSSGEKDCIKRPRQFKAWTGFDQTDWGNYAATMQAELGIAPEDANGRAQVEAFLKAVDVAPRSEYVRYYRKELKDWLKNGPQLPHWDTEKGYLKCE